MLNNSDDEQTSPPSGCTSNLTQESLSDHPGAPSSIIVPTITDSIAETTADDTNDLQILAGSLCDSHQNYERFARMLPYNTTDPELQQRQETLLSLLYTNNICTDENFKIFIAEPDLHQAEATRILEELYVLDVQVDMDVGRESDDSGGDTIDDAPQSPASQISTMTLGLALDSPVSCTKSRSVDEPKALPNEQPALFPVFNKEHAKPVESSVAEQLDVEIRNHKSTKWKPIGDDQYQIDAGQKKFGGTMCSCGMFYSVHEPEDEALHQKYHDIYNQLGFKV